MNNKLSIFPNCGSFLSVELTYISLLLVIIGFKLLLFDEDSELNVPELSEVWGCRVPLITISVCSAEVLIHDNRFTLTNITIHRKEHDIFFIKVYTSLQYFFTN